MMNNAPVEEQVVEYIGVSYDLAMTLFQQIQTFGPEKLAFVKVFSFRYPQPNVMQEVPQERKQKQASAAEEVLVQRSRVFGSPKVIGKYWKPWNICIMTMMTTMMKTMNGIWKTWKIPCLPIFLQQAVAVPAVCKTKKNKTQQW